MKGLVTAPSARIAAPKTTVPHLALAHHFAKLAAMHAGMALANSPEIVLADEPTANLDTHTGEEMIELMANLRDQLGVTIISATHDLKMLKRSDRILWIEDGRICKITTPEDLVLAEAFLADTSGYRANGSADSGTCGVCL